MQLRLFFSLFTFLLWTSLAHAQHNTADKAIQKILDQNPVAGLSVAVVKKDRIVYQNSFGMKDLEKKISLTDESLFRIASVSKSFTVTALMQLVEEKKLSLKDDVSNLIGFQVRHPDYPDKVITLEMLLSHTSAINDSEGYFNLDAIDPATNPDWKNCYNDYEPGKGYQYCNLNFNLAGTILERISGTRFDHYIVKHILQPLNIYGGYDVDELDQSLFATIYNFDPKTGTFTASPAAYASRQKEIEDYIIGRSAPIFSPTGGLKISAQGLARYMAMHMNKGKLDDVRIISRKSEKTMRKPRSDQENYGLALQITSKLIPGETLIGHTGLAYGLHSAMYFHPKKKYGIVVISSGNDPGKTDGFVTIIREIVNALYKEVVR